MLIRILLTLILLFVVLGYMMPPEKCGRLLGYGDYVTAIMCALDFEMTAVRYMLDHEHPNLPARAGDSNLYILGELSGHNIVLACLPGTQGKGAAAVVATNLARTFQSVQLRLFVGIGGGVPSSTHDIRLGDVVVSMPEGTYGGVMQYDLGKDTEDEFLIKGFLCPPPTILRNAAVRMRSDHFVTDNRIPEFVSSMVSRSRRLAIYTRPKQATDTLFRNDSIHVAGQATCNSCDYSQVVNREPRDPEAPEIHYGLIASGDRVIKSAAKRDQLAQNIGNVICFEMEAAGIATEYPCLVVRGISDYSDSHKNDSWRYYAAATAAACTKELLSHIKPADVEDISKSPTDGVQDSTSSRGRNSHSVSSFKGVGINNASGDFHVGGNLNISG